MALGWPRSAVSECSHRIAAHAGQGSMATAKRLVVVGGSGYVGSHIMRAALARGASVASVSRRGMPVASVSPPLDRAEWILADVQDSAALQNAMKGADAVISCLGAFGSNEFMRRVNGEQNEKIISAAAAGGVERFVYISAAPFGPIEKLIPGYFEGKRAAEAAVSKHFGDRGTVIQPGMVYGTRHVSKHVSIPLGIIGWPMSIFFQSSPVRGLANTLGRWGLLLVPPSSVEEVASTAVAAALGTNAENGGNSGAGGSQNAGQSGSAVALGWERIKQIAHSVEMSSVPAVTLFWDGGCPLCRREIGFYQRLDTKKRVNWVDIHESPSALEPHGVTVDKAMSLIHAVDNQGNLQVGVPAFLAVWEQLPYWNILPPILRRLPFAIPAIDAAYGFWARRRLQLTGRVHAMGGSSPCRK